MNTSNSNNQSRRKCRTMRYFINAASEILNEEGMDHLTTRSVAARAGYNSATIYNYFDNFERLVAFAAIKGLKDYVIDLHQSIDETMPPIEKFIRVWACYFKHSLLSPQVFSILFTKYEDNPLAFLKDYFDIFPEEVQELPEDIHETFFEKDFDLRNRLLLNKCAEEGMIKEADIDKIVDMSQFIYEGVFSNARKDAKKYNCGLFVHYLSHILLSFNHNLEDVLRGIDI